MSVPDLPRRVAADALLAVEQDGAYLNLLLPRLLRERHITGRDAAFATEITYGTARRAGILADVVGAAGGRDPGRLDPPVRVVLLLGAYQLLHTRVPAHAAISTAVDLVRGLAGPPPAGLVNAVLRKVAADDWEGWVRRLAPSEPLGRAAFRSGYPRWIAQAFLDALAGDLTAATAAMDDTAPAVHLAARPGRIEQSALLVQAGVGATAGPWSPYAVRLAGGDPASLEAVRRGDAGVQDEGSQLVALALCRALVDGRDGGRWLDVCAGPGGKAALLEGLLPAGGVLLANDRMPHRARLVAAALRISRVTVADGTRPAWPDGTFDRVLVDAPCTGLGALRRRPEARWRRQAADADRLADLQIRLLAAAIDAARPGGVVAYATCSPHPAETRGVVDQVLAVRPDAQRLDAPAVLPELPVARGSADPLDLQLWPHLHGTDAMFVSLLRRT